MDYVEIHQHNVGTVADVGANQNYMRRSSQNSDCSIYYDIEDEVDAIVENNTNENSEVNDNSNNTETKTILAATPEILSSNISERVPKNEKMAVAETKETIASQKTNSTLSVDNNEKYMDSSNNNHQHTSVTSAADSLINQQDPSFIADHALVQQLKFSQTSSKLQIEKTNFVNHTNLSREEYMYNIVFPDLNQFGLEKSFKTLEDIVRQYNFQQGNVIWNTSGNENFKMWNRVDLMDMRHMVLVLTSCGRWHGSVMALKQQRPKCFEQFRAKLYNIMQKYLANEEVMKTITKNFDKVICMLKGIGRGELAEKFKKTAGLFGDILLSDNVKYPVIALHADFWVDNIMFNEDVADTSEPKMFFSNFQLPMIDSPIRDLSYIIYCYGDKNLFEDFDFLLHAYYASLSDTLFKLGSDPDVTFPYEKMKREWRKYGMFGALMTLLEIFDETDGKGEGASSDMDDVRQSHQLYNKRVADVFIHYGENFL